MSRASHPHEKIRGPATGARRFVARPYNQAAHVRHPARAVLAATPAAAISATRLATDETVTVFSRAPSASLRDGGATAREKPSLAASLSLSAVWPTALTAPESAISPK